MDKSDISEPIHIILDGYNYILLAQVMCSFLKSSRFWRYITSDVTLPKQWDNKSSEAIFDRLDDWDSKNH